MTEILFKGTLKEFSFPKILIYLNRNRKTGTLIIKTPAFTKKIFLVKGDAIFASSTYEDDRLGEILLKAEKITMEQYDRSVELLKQTGKRQGAILVELGYLAPKDLFWGVKYQVREIIYSIFHLEDAEYDFFEGEIPTQEVITLKMSMGNLIYEGVKKIDNWNRIRNEMPDTDSILKMSSNPTSLFQNIELSSQDKEMLSVINGTKTIKELIDNSSTSSFEALKTLYVLWSIDMLEEKDNVVEKPDETEETVSLHDILEPFSEEEEAFRKRVDEIYSNLDRLSTNELLEINERSDEETIKKNYYKLAKEFHPDRYFSSNDPEIKDKLTTIFDALTQAYTTTKDSQKREPEYVSSNEKQQKEVFDAALAEEQFRQGVEEFKKGNFWGASDSLKWATKLDPKRPKYWSYLSLSLSKIPNRLKEAEEALIHAIKLDPYNAEHHANLGLIYMKAGMKKRAHSHFEKALKFDPENTRAKEGLEQTKK